MSEEIKVIPKASQCQMCGVKPKCKCKLKVYMIYNKHVTLCRDCLVKHFV